LDSDDDDYDELRVLVVLGSGMDGHLHTAHGGVAATLLDEAMGTIGGIHKSPGKATFTAFMHVGYKKPLPTGMQKSRFLFKKPAFMRNKKPRKIKSRGHVTAKMRQNTPHQQCGRLRGRCDELRG
jgi:hypothetical protein